MADISHISDGATEGTPEGAGARYTTIAAYESAQQGTLTTPNQFVLHDNYTGGLSEDNVVFDGWVTTQTNKIQGYAAPGAEYDYITDTGSKIVGIDTVTPATIRIGICLLYTSDAADDLVSV